MAGFSALYCCDNLKGSKSIVFNPQFFIQKWLSSWTFFTDKDFERCFDFSFADPQFFYRIDLRRITENKKSRFFIFLNTNSAQDKLQIDELARVSGFKYRTGIQKIGNIMLYIAPFNAPHPHQAFPIEQTCRIFLNSLYNFNLTNFEKDVYFAFTSMYAWHFRKLMDTNNKKICWINISVNCSSVPVSFHRRFLAIYKVLGCRRGETNDENFPFTVWVF